MQDSELAFLSLTGAAAAIASGETSSERLTRLMLDRIEALDGTLNSFITVLADRAMVQAKAMDDLLSAGIHLGPLHGVPIALKDNIETAGVTTTGASPLFRDHVPQHDATVAQRLTAAGSVMLGKLNLYELAFGGVHPDFGESRNPFDQSRACGASSCGPASAVAAGLCYGSLGTDTGGSIRLPAAACGLVGHKPSYGMVSRAGLLPASYSLDHIGPLTRSVADAAAMMAALVGPDLRDPAGSLHRAADFAQGPMPDLRGIRIGVPRLQETEMIDPEMREACDRAIATLAELGATLIAVAVPDHLHSRTLMWVLSGAEMADVHRDNLRNRPGDYTDTVRSNILQGAFLPAPEYVHAQRARRAIVDAYLAVMAQVDVLAMPVVPFAAWTIGDRRVRMGNQTEDLMPALTRYCPPFNMSGQPAVALPLGLNSEGLPLSFQLVGQMNDDARLLRIAAVFERDAHWAGIDFPDLVAG